LKTLIINTYGGSLALGAAAVPGVEVLGLYEDVGFGSDVQALNFPNVPRVESISDWPAQDLRDVVVIAHPPCSAFSVQNSSPDARGVDSKAFACTKRVLNYAMGNGAKAIAIESVMGALSGAWNVHQQYADQNGYHLYRVLQNGIMFSAQWRERFWAVFVKKGVAPTNMHLTLKPRWQTVKDVLAGVTDPRPFSDDERRLDELKHRFRHEAGCNEEEMAAIFGPHDQDGGVSKLLYKLKFADDSDWTAEDVRVSFVCSFATAGMRFLHPDKYAPVILGSSWWNYQGANVPIDGYKLLAGFPRSYKFPKEKKMRSFLSKGVIPAVASWILGQLTLHLEDKSMYVAPYELWCEPNGIADFRISRDGWLRRNEELPKLRSQEA
jgi:site-specific DNA-cytosine methylase